MVVLLRTARLLSQNPFLQWLQKVPSRGSEIRKMKKKRFEWEKEESTTNSVTLLITRLFNLVWYIRVTVLWSFKGFPFHMTFFPWTTFQKRKEMIQKSVNEFRHEKAIRIMTFSLIFIPMIRNPLF